MPFLLNPFLCKKHEGIGSIFCILWVDSFGNKLSTGFKSLRPYMGWIDGRTFLRICYVFHNYQSY